MVKLTYGLLLTSKGESKKVRLPQETLTLNSIQTILKKKELPVCLGTYPFESLTFHLFGYAQGKAGTENKHELPPPLDETLVFGDILVIASRTGSAWSQPVTLTPEQYETFYNQAYGGFEDLESDEDESEEDSEDEEEEENEEEKVKKEAEEKEKTTKKDKEEGIDDDFEEELDEDELDEEEEEEEGEDVEDVEEGEKEYEEEKKKAPSKKKTKANLTYTQNTGRAKQQQMLEAKKISPMAFVLGTTRPIPTDTSMEARMRSQCVAVIQSRKIPKKLKPATIELTIFESAYRDALKKQVCVHFENPLFQVLYKSAARRIVGNLDKTSYIQNEQFATKLASGDLTLEHVKSMNTMDFAPHLYSELRERQLSREQNQLEGNKSRATDMFKCGRCHKRETTFYELQTRSADEPMTKFITCLNCGNHWRK